MTWLRQALPAYSQIAMMWVKRERQSHSNSAIWMAGSIVQIFLMVAIWKAAYGTRPSVAGMGLGQVTTYVALVTFQTWLIPPFIVGFMQERVRQGVVAVDLVRPVGLLGQIAAHQVGMTLSYGLYLIVALPVAMLVGWVGAPVTPGAGVAYGLSIALGYATSVMVGMLMALAAFWLFQVGGIQMMYFFIGRFFSGGIVPLSFLPGPLQFAARAMPFQAMGFIPAGIYVGVIRGSAVLWDLLIQAGWFLCLLLLARLIWALARRSLLIQGG